MGHHNEDRRTIVAVPILVALLQYSASCASAAELTALDRLPATRIDRVDEFVAADAFRVGNKIGGRTLSVVGPNFTQHFIDVVEKDVPAVALSIWTLNYTEGDKSLIEALGGEAQAVLPFLAYIYQVMKRSEEGGGHTDGRSNFAYMRSPVDQRLWAVHWTANYANEWTIGAVIVPHPDLDWRAQSRLFSNEPAYTKPHPDDAGGPTMSGASHALRRR